MADSRRHQEWFDKAGEEFKAAEILMEHGGDYAVIAFLCQQTIEKAFKGFILKHRETLVEGHSLIFLCRKSAGIDGAFKEFMKDSAYVNQFYLETRYPADAPMEITKSDARECMEIAGAILKAIV